MRLAERQVLEAVEELPRGGSLPSSRIKSPESTTRAGGTDPGPDAVGGQICGFQDDVYQVARWLEDQAAFSVLETKDYISYPKENGYRSYHHFWASGRVGQG